MKTQRIGITFSSFDLLHAGHIKMLEEAKTVCDYLIVGLQIDPSHDRPTKNKPIRHRNSLHFSNRFCWC